MTLILMYVSALDHVGGEKASEAHSWLLAVLQTLSGGGISFAADARKRQMLFNFNETNSLSGAFSLFI